MTKEYGPSGEVIVESGMFIAGSVFEPVSIPGGQTSDIVEPCPVGKQIRLTLLVADANEPGITVSFGARVVASGVTVAAEASTSRTNFKVGPSIDGGGSNHLEIIGDVDEDLTLSFAGATGGFIYYGYEVSK